ncbi:MAG TPA: NAD(P)-binding domain-containing protein [Actinoplanes sp.]|jgi:putative flavoprotein involved in K+ transport|nr:NAD(P)-binding domain-containing protein [Actinoplanes sp.]
MSEHVETVIIGAGQAGLSTGYHLARRGRQFVILEAWPRVGDVWRHRFDSLRLYSPAWADSLPGFPFPAERWSYPTKDDMADYLEAYAERFALPVRTGVVVDEVARDGDGYVVTAGAHRFEADNVVVASGTFQRPIVPEFAAELDPAIRQLHSGDYHNPRQLRDGPVLVVGASHSGGDIAFEVARTHPTILSGKDRGQIPFRHDSRAAHVIFPIMVFLARNVLTMHTPVGRRLRHEVRAHGGPLIRTRRTDLVAAGVERVHERVTGVRDGRPVLEDGRVLDVTNVIWCTGFDKDSGWIRIPVTGDDGWPEQVRGAVPASPGLYFVGLPFLQSFSSMLVAGVGRDARYVADRIAAHSSRRRRRAVA